MATKFYYEWQALPAKTTPLKQRFSTGISLHGHTWRSLESLAFLPGALENVYVLPRIMRWVEKRYERKWHKKFEYAEGYWTSPVSPEAALALETKQIETVGLRPIVSLTDHEAIMACHELAKAGHKNIPVSLEWTVPYKNAVFHIGVHNIPAAECDTLVKSLNEYTARPDHAKALPKLLERLNAFPEVLVIFNHPLSDQGRIGHEMHEPFVHEFLATHGKWIHALEINTFQPWDMNRRVAAIADDAGLPLLAGGDRHAFEPNGGINLTNATTFGAFAREVREKKTTAILFMPQCRRPLGLRYAENVDAILGEYPELAATKRAHWHDRVFYHCPDGVTRSLTQMIGKRFYALDTTSLFFETLGFFVNRIAGPIEPSPMTKK